MQSMTAVLLVLAGIALLAWEANVLWHRRTDATISWVTFAFSVSAPVIQLAWFVLTSHFFWPRCGPVGKDVINPHVGGLLTLGAIGVLLWELEHRIHVPKITKVSPLYFARLAALAVIGVALGHYAFGQYVECAS